MATFSFYFPFANSDCVPDDDFYSLSLNDCHLFGIFNLHCLSINDCDLFRIFNPSL